MAAGVGESFDRPIFRPEYLAETVDRSLEFLPLDIGLRFERADRPGVVRLFEGQVRPGELDAYVDEARAGTLQDAAAGSGPMALYLARRTADAFVTLSVWPDWSTLQDATGGDVERPIATRHAHRLVAWHAEHYKSIPGLTPARRTPATHSLTAHPAACRGPRRSQTSCVRNARDPSRHARGTTPRSGSRV